MVELNLGLDKGMIISQQRMQIFMNLNDK